ncbi:peptidoglycan-binding protein [Lentzea sp. E54]|uniref:peptidoglycan-binding protein n=1 Tax=Lentzea xerophila TaxID=3435883 RepID=UPI003DA39F01
MTDHRVGHTPSESPLHVPGGPPNSTLLAGTDDTGAVRAAPATDRRRRRLAAGVLVIVLAAGAVAAFVLVGRPRTSTADDKAPDLPPGRATVTRQTLHDRQTADGELGYGTDTTAVSRLSGTLTSVPDGGTVVARGKALYAVDGLPVVLMHGAMPAYRPLSVGTEGTDVRQLEENLAALGHTGFTVDEQFTASTGAAVGQWQAGLGLAATGVVELGRVVFAPGDVRVGSVAAGASRPVRPGDTVLTYSGTAKAVTVELEAADQRVAAKDAAVEITLPDGTTTAGKVERVSTMIAPATAQGQEPTTKVEVVVGLADQKAVAAYALASVDVTFTAEERADVLVVPVAALLALREGGYGVEVVEGNRSRYVPVETGLFADGLVEISGAGIEEGMTVGVAK